MSPTDRLEYVETPEHVAIHYELADLGSRFVALLIDFGIILSCILLVGIGLVLALGLTLESIPGVLAGWVVALLILALFLFVWGYFVYFEALRDGQTPGKRLLRIRAVHDGGFPVTLRGAVVRNLLRAVDAQPLPSWLVGGVAMMLHPRTKRLGDMAAGTVVVRERRAAVLPEEAPQTTSTGRPRLSREELATLTRYVARRDALRPEVRGRIARRILSGLQAALGEDVIRQPDPDGFLLTLRVEESARHERAGGGGAAGGPQAAALVRRQRSVWTDFLALLGRAQRRGLRSLPEAELSRFAGLYRELSADLARARTYEGSPDLLYSLERWVGAGHNLLYRPGRRSWRRMRGFLLDGFPALVRRRWAPIALAAAFLFLPSLAAYTAVLAEPERAWSLMPAELIARAEEAPRKAAQGEGYVDVPEPFMPVMASGIIANNVQVTFMAFAGGILAGLGTVLILVMNGVLLGGVAGLFAHHQASLHLWSFVLPHGITELTAICVAGGAGLWLGSSLLIPGRLTRAEALVVRGREAVGLLAGTVLLLLVAGLIEGFISPARIATAAKLSFAAVFAAALALYLLLGGRKIREGLASSRPGSDSPPP